MPTNTDNYITKAKECGILVGDYVQITRKVTQCGENGWNFRWLSSMDKNIGEVGKVRAIDNDLNFCVRLDGDDICHYYPYFVLKMVCRPAIFSRFTVGDRVLIKRNWKRGEYGTYVSFNDEKMVKTVGKLGIITKVIQDDNEIKYVIRCDNKTWTYPEFVLKKAEKPNSKFKIFDKVLVRDACGEYWELAEFAYMMNRDGKNHYPYHIVGGGVYGICIPYEGNEHLLGTDESPE